MYAKNLKKLRAALNLSVEKLSEAVGVPASTIWGYEGHKRVPSVDFPIQLYRKFNVNINWFLTGNGEMFMEDKNLDENFIQKVEIVLKKNKLI